MIEIVLDNKNILRAAMEVGPYIIRLSSRGKTKGTMHARAHAQSHKNV